MKSDSLLVIGALGLAAYVIHKTLNVGDKFKESLASVGSAIGSGLFDLFNPESDYLGDMYFYTVEFPNGKRHSIGASLVNAAGQFDKTVPPLSAARWQLVKRKDNKGWYAAPVK